MSYELVLGDAVSTLRLLGDATVDAVLTDPPYPEIDRDYGRFTVNAWWALITTVAYEARRVLKPTGSAVFILQPNSERVGSVRPWLFDFQAWICRHWNMVQDAWWWNWGAMPRSGRHNTGLLRPSLKACVWAGAPDCYRNQDAVLWEPSDDVKVLTRENRAFKVYRAPNGKVIDKAKIAHASVARGGVTPFNVIPLGNTASSESGPGVEVHPAGTPAKLCAWWVEYITPPGGLVVDPFSGAGTVVREAVKLGREAIGIERHEAYHKMALARMATIPVTGSAESV